VRRYNDTLVVPYHCPSYIAACYTLGFERAMQSMLEDKEFFRHLINRYDMGLDAMMRSWKQGGAEVVFIADSWASCDIISPDLFKEFAFPAQCKITQAAHDNGLKIILWNAGNILPILEMEAEAGFDAFGFEQARKGVDITVARVREVFKDKCILGNIDSEELLISNDRVRIERETESQIRQADGKPFIFSQGSPIPQNVSVEAVDVMMNKFKEIIK